MEKKLRKHIESVLANVEPDNAPNIYEKIQTENGYKAIEKMIIRMSVNDGITVSACIPNIENQM